MQSQYFEKQIQELSKKLSTQNIKHEMDQQLNKQTIEQLQSQLQDKECKNDQLKKDMQKVMEALQAVQLKDGKGNDMLNLLVRIQTDLSDIKHSNNNTVYGDWQEHAARVTFSQKLGYLTGQILAPTTPTSKDKDLPNRFDKVIEAREKSKDQESDIMDDEHVFQRIGNQKRVEGMGQSVDYLLDDRYGAKAEKYQRIGKGQSLRPSKTQMQMSKDHSVISDKTQQINKREDNQALGKHSFYEEEARSDRASEDTIQRYKNELALKFKSPANKRDGFYGGQDVRDVRQENNHSYQEKDDTNMQLEISNKQKQNLDQQGMNRLGYELAAQTSESATLNQKSQKIIEPRFRVENVQIPHGVFEKLTHHGYSDEKLDFTAQNIELTQRAKKQPHYKALGQERQFECDQTLEEFRRLKEQYRQDMILHSQYLREHRSGSKNQDFTEIPQPQTRVQMNNQNSVSGTGQSPMLSPRDFENLDIAQLNMRISQNRTNTSPNTTKLPAIDSSIRDGPKNHFYGDLERQQQKQQNRQGVFDRKHPTSQRKMQFEPNPEKYYQHKAQIPINSEDRQPQAQDSYDSLNEKDLMSKMELQELDRLRELRNLNKIKKKVAEELSKSQMLDQLIQQTVHQEVDSQDQDESSSKQMSRVSIHQKHDQPGQTDALKSKLSAIGRSGKFEAINADEIMRKKTQMNLSSLRLGRNKMDLGNFHYKNFIPENQIYNDKDSGDLADDRADVFEEQKMFYTMDHHNQEKNSRHEVGTADNRHYFSSSKLATNSQVQASRTPEYTGAQSPFLDTSSIGGKSHYRDFIQKNNMSLSQLSQLSQSKKSLSGSTRQKAGSFLNLHQDKSAGKRQIAHNHSISAINYIPNQKNQYSQSKRNYSINPQMDTILENKNDLSGYLKSQKRQTEAEPVRLKSININVAEQKIQMILSNGETSTKLIEQTASRGTSVYDPTQKLAARRQDQSIKNREEHIRELREAYKDEFQDSSNIFERSEFKYDRQPSLRPSNFSKDFLNEKNILSHETSFLARDFSSKSRPTLEQYDNSRSQKIFKPHVLSRGHPGDLRKEIKSHYLTQDDRNNFQSQSHNSKSGYPLTSSRSRHNDRLNIQSGQKQHHGHSEQQFYAEDESSNLYSRPQLTKAPNSQSQFDLRLSRPIQKVPSQASKISLSQKGPSISRREVIEILKLHKAVQNKIQEMQNLKIQT